MSEAPTDETPAEENQPTTEQTETETEGEAADRPGREAAKYRTRLRETEAERDKLAEALAVYRRREAEQYAEAAGLARGADLFDIGTDLGTLLTEEGTVDEQKVRDAVSATLTERPHWGRPPQTLDLGIRGAEVTKRSDWADVLKGRR